MLKFKSNFEYKNERKYVHSTTMISALRTIVHNSYYPEPEWEMTMIDARFHKQVHCNGDFYISEKRSDLDTIGEVAAEFRYYDKEHDISAVFVEQKDAMITNRVNVDYSVEGVVMDGDFSGTCIIDCSSTSNMVENIIEANKKIHQMTLKDKDNLQVVNLYMKKVPVSLSAFSISNTQTVALKIENVGARIRDDSIATLNTLSFPGEKMSSFEMSYIAYWK